MPLPLENRGFPRTHQSKGRLAFSLHDLGPSCTDVARPGSSAVPGTKEAADMSRHSPTGFGFSVLLEVAAVVAIVAFLPRVDLRPSVASAAFSQDAAADRVQIPAEAPVSPVGWTALDIRNGEATRATSYYERATPQSPSSPPSGSFSPQPMAAAPPFIDANRPDPKYVEERLDRASQQLVNSVGTAVNNAANNWLAPPKPQSPVATTVGRPRTAPAASSQSPQPRPWLRY